MDIVVMPQTVISLSEFLKSYSLTLLVRQTGSSKWEASFEPEVLVNLDDDSTQLTIEGESTQEVVQAMCAFLSGNEDLSVADDELDLDLYYTKVENDWDGSEKGTESVLKGALRHHGGE